MERAARCIGGAPGQVGVNVEEKTRRKLGKRRHVIIRNAHRTKNRRPAP
jgi:hypothetical protein